jgi:hypothetical protein
MGFFEDLQKILVDFETSIMAEVKEEIAAEFAIMEEKPSSEYVVPYMNVQNIDGYLKDMDGEFIDVNFATNSSKINNKDETQLRKYIASQPHFVSEYSGALQGGDGWSHPSTREKVGTINSGVDWDDRSDFDKEWMTAMGIAGVKHFNPNITVWRETANKDRTGYSFSYTQVRHMNDSYLCVAGFVKHIQGDVPYGWWCNGLVGDGKIHLCGGNWSSGTSHYVHTHPYKNNTTGEDSIIEYCLIGSVDRYVDLSNVDNWWHFKNITYKES